MVTFRAWNRNWHGLALIALMTANTHQAMVESVTETHVGMATLIRGTTSEQTRYTFFSLPMVAPISAAGVVTALGFATLQDTNALWRDDQYSGTNGAFYVEFDSGLMADIVGCDALLQTLTLSDNLPASVDVGKVYRIRQHRTLAAILGANNEAGLKPGLQLRTADNIELSVRITNDMVAARYYYYSSHTNGTGWRDWVGKPANDTVVYPEQALVVHRKITNDIVFSASGVVKDNPTLAPVFTGDNLVGTLQQLRSLKLSELNLHTDDLETGLAGGRSPGEADNLVVRSTDNTTTTYFYCNTPRFEGWWTAAATRADDVQIPPGSAFSIVRKMPRPPFDWIIPPE